MRRRAMTKKTVVRFFVLNAAPPDPIPLPEFAGLNLALPPAAAFLL